MIGYFSTLPQIYGVVVHVRRLCCRDHMAGFTARVGFERLATVNDTEMINGTKPSDLNTLCGSRTAAEGEPVNLVYVKCDEPILGDVVFIQGMVADRYLQIEDMDIVVRQDLGRPCKL